MKIEDIKENDGHTQFLLKCGCVAERRDTRWVRSMIVKRDKDTVGVDVFIRKPRTGCQLHDSRGTVLYDVIPFGESIETESLF